MLKCACTLLNIEKLASKFRACKDMNDVIAKVVSLTFDNEGSSRSTITVHIHTTMVVA